ncbi:metalloproteinase inhibitor 3-like [Anneissia japonica]|uniref:metalloproteinase inhibitor 3-like n=1 Tax=Anneissia japonica TaxID=1529436 RepID=UPI00142556D8|nr:metalloproteinase inhibitor 3-like [Anneissia japonica]
MKVLVIFLVFCCLQASLACYCSLDHPQKKFCKADYAIRGKIISKEKVYPHTNPTIAPTSETTPSPVVNFAEPVGFGPVGFGGMAENPSLPGDSKRPIAIKYFVRVEKIYKGKDLMPEKKVEIITPPTDSLCGITNLEVDSVYLLSGRKWEDDLRIETCGWIAKYDDLTKRQRQGLKKTYNNCDDCQIQLCYGPYCPTKLQESLCMWDSSGLFEDCEGKYAHCMENKRGKCVWNGKSDYKACKAKREAEKDARLP